MRGSRTRTLIGWLTAMPGTWPFRHRFPSFASEGLVQGVGKSRKVLPRASGA